MLLNPCLALPFKPPRKHCLQRFVGLVNEGLFWIQIIYLKDYPYLMNSCSYSNRMIPFKHLGLKIMLGTHMLLHQWPARSVHRYMISESGCSQISACCLAAAQPTDGRQTEFHREHVCAGGRVSRRSQILISEQDCHNRVWFFSNGAEDCDYANQCLTMMSHTYNSSKPCCSVLIDLE